MFTLKGIKAAKPAPKKLPSKSRFSFIRVFTDSCYRDPYRWSLIKCAAFFATGIYVARTLSDLNILPGEEAAQAIQSSY